MPGPRAELMLHPIRLRILTAISTYRMAAKEIAGLLPDIPLTTLYRHINLLVEGGLIHVVEEKPVRGTIEHVYAVTAPPSLKSEDLHGMTKAECEQAFTMYLSTLMIDAQQYLHSKPDNSEINPLEDGVEINKAQFYLDDEEFNQMNSKILELMLDASKYQPAAGRQRRMFSSIFIPLGKEQKKP
jgi:Fe2+ or Zn2+ uptake regulation protein